MNYEKILQRVIGISIGLSALTLVLYVLLGFHIRMVADDYCTAVQGVTYGPVEGVQMMYQTWASEYSNFFIKFIFAQYQPEIHRWLPLLTLFFWLIATAYLLKHILHYLKLPNDAKYLLPLTILVSFTFYRLMPSYQHAFWFAAVIPYTWSLILTIFYAGIVLQYFQKERSLLTQICFLLFAIIAMLLLGGFVSTMITMLGIILASLFLLTSTMAQSRRREIQVWSLASGFTLLAVLLIVMASPGVGIRREAIAALGDGTSLSAIEALPAGLLFTVSYSFGEVFGATFGQTYAIAFLFNMVVLIFFAGLFFLEKYPDYQLPAPPSLRFAFFASFVIALASIFGVIYPSTYAASGFLPMRPLVQTRLIQLILFGYWSYLALIVAQRNRLLLKLRRAKTWTPVLIAVSFLLLWSPLISIYKLVNLYPDYQAYAQSWEERHQLLLNTEADSAIIVPALKYDIEDNFVLKKAGDNPNFWVNNCIEDFYGLESFTVEVSDEVEQE